MSIRYVVLLAGRKCLKIFRRLRTLRMLVNHPSKLNKIQPEGTIPYPKEMTNLDTINQESIELAPVTRQLRKQFLNAKQTSKTPPFPLKLRSSPGRQPSVYENVNCSYDSAYGSEGLEYIDWEEGDASHREEEKREIEICKARTARWIDRCHGDNEDFENVWNETIESLVTLS